MMVAKLRPETDIPGLYMTGQVWNHENLPFGYTTFIVVFHSKIAIIIYCLYIWEKLLQISQIVHIDIFRILWKQDLLEHYSVAL